MSIASAVSASCLGLYGLYKLYNHFYDFTPKDAKKLLDNIQELELTSRSIATMEIDYATWQVAEPLVDHVMKLTQATRDCEHYMERINYGLPILEKKRQKNKNIATIETLLLPCVKRLWILRILA